MLQTLLQFSKHFNPFVLIALGACGNLMGDYFSKKYTDTTLSWSFALMLLGYIISGTGYTFGFYQLRQYFVSEVFYYSVVTIGSVILGYFVFGERLHGLQLFGTLLCFAGIVCVIISSK